MMGIFSNEILNGIAPELIPLALNCIVLPKYLVPFACDFTPINMHSNPNKSIKNFERTLERKYKCLSSKYTNMTVNYFYFLILNFS